jgi:acetolactate synthase-1/2/3 large subunit
MKAPIIEEQRMSPQREVAQEQVVSVSQGADVYIESLNANDVKYLFINSGTDTFPIQESLAKYMSQGRSVPQVILCLDEEMAMSAAHGYFMVRQKPQVLLVHVDAGTLQVGGALHNAQRGRAGMVFCAGRAPYTFEGELPGGKTMKIHWLQEQIDQGSAVRMFTKWDYEIRRPETIQQVMQRAFQIASSEPAGPVYVSLPREVLMATAETARMPAPSRYTPIIPPYPNPEALAEAADILAHARRPMIITSQSGRHPQTVAHLVELAELLGAPVASDRVTMSFPTSHPLFAGRSAAQHLKEADAILLVDADVPWIPVLQKPRPDAHIISIDQDPLKPTMPLHFFPADLLIQASSAEAVPALNWQVRSRMKVEAVGAAAERRSAAEEASRRRWSELERAAQAASSKRPIEPEWLAYCIGQVIGEDDIVLDETVTNQELVGDYVRRSRPETMFGSGGSSLGWALGAAIGAKLATPDRRVVALVGDGAFNYGCPTSAYWAADKYNVPFLTVIFNNQTHFATKRAMLAAYPQSVAKQTNNFLGLEISPSPEYALTAQSCRAYGEKVEDPREVQPALRRGLERVDAGQAAVIDVRLRRP